MKVTPSVSVLLPVYNGERYLRQAIASICNQSWTDVELIVVDDGSTDNTPIILAECAACDQRLVLLRHVENRGIVAALNAGLAHARGEYVARQDADDWSFPNRLAKQVQFLNDHPHIAVVGTAAFTLPGPDSPRQIWRRPTHPALLGWRLLFSNPLIHTSVLFRRQVIAEAGGYSMQFPYAEDYDLWTRLNATHQQTNLADILVTRRLGIGVSTRYALLQRTSIMQIMQQSITRLLGEPLLLEEIAALYQIERGQRFHAPVGFKRMKQIHQTLFAAYCRRSQLTAMEVHLIETELQQQLAQLGSYYASWPKRLLHAATDIRRWQKLPTLLPQLLTRQGVRRVTQKLRR